MSRKTGVLCALLVISAFGIGLAAEHHAPRPLLYSLEGAWLFLVLLSFVLALRRGK